MSRCDMRVLCSVRELAALRDDWECLSQPFGTPLLDHDWFLSAAETLHDANDLRVVTIRESGRLIAAAPMAPDSSGRHLVPIGTSTLYEPSGWLFASESSLQHLAAAVVDLGEVTVLDRVPASSPACTLLPAIVRGRAITISRDTSPSHVVATNRSWSSLCSSLSASTVRRLEASHARAKQLGATVRFEMMKPTSGDVDKALALFIKLEAAGWKGRNGSALAMQPALSQFFRVYARRAAQAGRLRMNIMWIGETPAAAELAVQAHRRFWGLKIAYDERFASCAPAIQTVHASIKAATEDGLLAYEFLGSAEPWQQRWKPQQRAYKLAALYPLSRRSAVTALYDLAAVVSRRLQSTPRLSRVTTS